MAIYEMYHLDYYIVIGLFSFLFLLIKKFKVNPYSVLFYSIGVIYVVNVIDYTFYDIPTNVTGPIRMAIEQENNIIPFHQWFLYFSDCIKVKRFIPMSTLFSHTLLNLIMGFPLGFFIPLITNKKYSFKRILLIALSFWFLIEFGQFIVNHIVCINYRSVDIDDLILNSLGTLVGFITFNFLLNFFLNATYNIPIIQESKIFKYLSNIKSDVS